MHLIINILIAIVWLANGLLCKGLNLVLRHQQIVAKIIGSNYAFLVTKIIGILEILMAAWIISDIKADVCAVLQIVVIMLMNCIEFIYAKELLLFGKLNIVIAVLFCCVIYVNQFILYAY